MSGMRPRFQFSTSTILLITAFIAISLGAFMHFDSLIGRSTLAERWEQLRLFAFWSPLFMPFVFAAYAVGRRAITIWQLIAFAIAEGAVNCWLWSLPR